MRATPRSGRRPPPARHLPSGARTRGPPRITDNGRPAGAGAPMNYPTGEEPGTREVNGEEVRNYRRRLTASASRPLVVRSE